ncbi:MAG: NAD(P)-binding domain-containing protein [Desulfurococcales archaeon]|nr:NAD(P)-binding domain-containing protein [Desulfurococcales archaeon]
MQSLVRLAGFHIRWRTAGEDLVGKLQGYTSKAYNALLPLVDGAVVISTCNRFEAYVDTRDPASARRALEDALPGDARPYIEETRGMGTVTHLMHVTTGLDSALLGEHEVLGQVRRAWREAKARGYTTWLLDQAFHRALVAGRRARAETGIGRGRVGYPEVAVDIAVERMKGLDGASVAVVGAGNAARGILLSACSVYKPRKVVVYNRTLERAFEAARICGGEARGLNQLGDEAYDVMFVAITGYRLSREALSLARLVVDISNPPAASGPNVVGFDEVTRIAKGRIELRRRWIPMVKSIIEEEAAALEAILERSAGDKAAGLVMRYAYSLIESEVEATLRSIRRGRGERESLETAFESYARKVLHPLLAALRKASLEGRHDLVEFVVSEYGRRINGEGKA